LSIFDAIDLADEPSSLVAFAGNSLDRRSENRNEDCLRDALASDKMRAFAMCGGKAFLRMNGDGFEALHQAGELEPFDPDFDNAILLGFAENDTPRLAVPVRLDPEDLPETVKAIDHRSIYIQGLVSGSLLGELAQGASLLAWARSNRHCGRCGEPTLPRAGGYRRECPSCGNMLFPRTDPVVIMLTIDTENDRCLLGRSPHFPPGVYSCLAGFLEPGETMEEAVRRETHEESGIRVGRVRYHATQPWPMPHTLMIGCFGEAASTEINMDSEELEDCRWFSRDEAAALLSQQIEDGDLTSPPPGAIAHHLIRDWLSHKP
jgi:NAD+ diphosphatase